MPALMQNPSAAQGMPQQPMAGQTQGMSMEQPIGQNQNPANYISQENLIDEREATFEVAFKDLAYNVFMAKYPDLTPSVVTFKVIKTSVESGDGVGAFILNHQGESIYLPVIMSDNNLKPLDVMYSKRMDKFLPFNKEWLEIIFSTSQQSLGEGVPTPETLVSDVDIASMIYPPIDGRINYAMDLSEINHLDLIKQASNEVKLSYRQYLERHKDHLKFAAENFGAKELYEALRLHAEKTAAAVTEELQVVDASTPAEAIQNIFGRDSRFAMQKIAEVGFAYRDNRKDTGSVYTTDVKMVLEEPAHSGAYLIYSGDGHYEPALIFINPDRLDDSGPIACGPYHARKGINSQELERKEERTREYLVVLANGDYFSTNKIIGTPIPKEKFGTWDSSARRIYDTIYGERKSSPSISSSNVMFVKVDGDVISGTEPLYVDVTEVTSDRNKKYVKRDPYAPKSNEYIWRDKTKANSSQREIIHADTHTGKILRTSSKISVVPTSYRAIKIGDRLGTDSCNSLYLSKPKDVLQLTQLELSTKGGKALQVSNIGGGEYSINHRPIGSYKTAALKLASEFYITVDDALKVLDRVSIPNSKFECFVMPSEKQASMFSTGVQGGQLSPELAQQMGGQQQQAMEMNPTAPTQPMNRPPQNLQPTPMMDPQMMNAGLATGDPNLYSVGVLNSLAHNPDIRELLAVYSPALEKALDSLGRMLLTFWIKGTKAKQTLGEDTYYSTEEALRSVFRGMGNLMIKVNRQSVTTPEHADAGL